MNRMMYLIEAEGPANNPGLFAIGIAESSAGARAWLVWFARFYIAEGWKNFQYYSVPAPVLEEMMAAHKENNQ